MKNLDLEAVYFRGVHALLQRSMLDVVFRGAMTMFHLLPFSRSTFSGYNATSRPDSKGA